MQAHSIISKTSTGIYLHIIYIYGLTMREVKLALKAIAWRKVREVWREEARGRPKLGMIGRLIDYECKAVCKDV